MAVGDFLRPQRSPLSVYDEQMAQLLRQQSAGIGARDIAAESALGFPVGTMTSKILGNVLAGAKAKSAINRDAEADRARSLYAQYLKTGKIDGKSVDESGNIYEMTEQPMFKEEQGNEELAIAVGKFFKERYGGLENIKKTFRTDPVGFAADLSIILTGGAMLPARTTGTVGKFSKIIQATGNAIDPLTASLKVGSLAKKVPKYLGGSILDVVSGAKGGLTSANVVRAYDAGKTGGQTQEAFKIGKGGAVEATANIPVIGKMVENISGLRQNKAGFVQNLIDDLEKLKILNLNLLDFFLNF